MKNPIESIRGKVDDIIGTYAESAEEKRRNHERELRSVSSKVIDLSWAISMPGKNVTSIYAHLLDLADQPEVIERAIERAEYVLDNGLAHDRLASQGLADDGSRDGIPARPAQNAADPLYRYDPDSIYWHRPDSSED